MKKFCSDCGSKLKIAGKLDNFSVEELEEVYIFLDGLRESGVTNMFGAGSYIEDELGYDKSESRSLLSSWMETFGDGSNTPEERAIRAKEENL